MTTFTSEDRNNALPKEGSKWAGSDTRQEFTVLAVWNPNEEPDPWVRYRNQDDSEFTCRLEAFLSRFAKIPD
jgi:hypothetical protein